MAYANVMVHFDMSDKIMLVVGTDDVGRMKRMMPLCQPNLGPEELGASARELLGQDGTVRVVVLKVECVFVHERVDRVLVPPGNQHPSDNGNESNSSENHPAD